LVFIEYFSLLPYVAVIDCFWTVRVRYPETLDEFYRARLPGIFDDSRAGKRMTLPVPETWETQVALKGNKARMWQDLIGNLLYSSQSE